MFHPPLMCPWECHQIGGPWIAENPDCPFHGSNPVDLEELDSDEGERMCREKELLDGVDEYLRTEADNWPVDFEP